MNLEVLKLGSCTDLLELPKSIRSLHKLCILDISNCLSIRHLPKDIGELCNLKEFHMKGCMSLRKGCHHQLQNLSNWSLWYVMKRGPSGWKRYQLDLVSQTMISENSLFGKFCRLCQLIIIIFYSLFLFSYISAKLSTWKNMYQ